jgi:hypothetical protein
VGYERSIQVAGKETEKASEEAFVHFKYIAPVSGIRLSIHIVLHIFGRPSCTHIFCFMVLLTSFFYIERFYWCSHSAKVLHRVEATTRFGGCKDIV